MKFTRARAGKTADLTQLVVSAVWSGDIRACARTLKIELVSITADADGPEADVALGDRVAFFADAQLFDGFVFAVQRSTSGRTMTVTAYDRGIYLTRNQCYYKFSGIRPEAAARRIAADFGLTVGEIAAPGVNVSRNLVGVTVYKALSTLYTLAAAQTGEKYHIGFELDRLVIREKKPDAETLIVQGGSNLLSASVTESIEEMTNRVVIVTDEGGIVSKLDTMEDIAAYGLMQSVVKSSDGAQEEARALLESGGAAQKVAIECMGDVRSITGRTVAVHEPRGGLWGVYWIESDRHTWKNGIYTNQLTVSLKCVMDENEAGSELSAAISAAGSGASTASGGWAYYRQEG